MRYSEQENVSPDDFKRLTGVSPSVFGLMAEAVVQYKERPRKYLGRGRKPYKISLGDEVLILLAYYREYRTFISLGVSFGISEMHCWRVVARTEKALLASKKFRLPGRRALWDAESPFEVVVVDATEHPVERPKKKQKRYYSGKKKRHTMKTQLLVDRSSRRIICAHTGKGSRHDFRMFRESRAFPHKNIKTIADSGYQGIEGILDNCLTPRKKPKGGDLTKEDKRHNREVGSQRIVVEHAIRAIKVFKILALPYRNRRKRLALRVNLIAAIVNTYFG